MDGQVDPVLPVLNAESPVAVKDEVANGGGEESDECGAVSLFGAH